MTTHVVPFDPAAIAAARADLPSHLVALIDNFDPAAIVSDGGIAPGLTEQIIRALNNVEGPLMKIIDQAREVIDDAAALLAERSTMLHERAAEYAVRSATRA